MTHSKITAYILTVALCTMVGSLSAAEPARIAAKPPLGWNSFDSYGVYLHEQAASVVSHK